MSPKEISRRADEELFNRGNLAVADELFAADFVYHDAAGSDAFRGPAGVRAYVTMFRNAFPDLHLAIEDVVAEGEKVSYRWTATGTHTGEFMGIPPTGGAIRVGGIAIARVVQGKIAEIWEHYDAVGMMRQLGALTL